MKCVMCKQGETQPSGDVCENCGEYHLLDSITERILGMTEEVVKKEVEVEILRLAA